jgi:hypothetical protein
MGHNRIQLLLSGLEGVVKTANSATLPPAKFVGRIVQHQINNRLLHQNQENQDCIKLNNELFNCLEKDDEPRKSIFQEWLEYVLQNKAGLIKKIFDDFFLKTNLQNTARFGDLLLNNYPKTKILLSYILKNGTDTEKKELFNPRVNRSNDQRKLTFNQTDAILDCLDMKTLGFNYKTLQNLDDLGIDRNILRICLIQRIDSIKQEFRKALNDQNSYVSDEDDSDDTTGYFDVSGLQTKFRVHLYLLAELITKELKERGSDNTLIGDLINCLYLQSQELIGSNQPYDLDKFIDKDTVHYVINSLLSTKSVDPDKVGKKLVELIKKSYSPRNDLNFESHLMVFIGFLKPKTTKELALWLLENEINSYEDDQPNCLLSETTKKRLLSLVKPESLKDHLIKLIKMDYNNSAVYSQLKCLIKYIFENKKTAIFKSIIEDKNLDFKQLMDFILDNMQEKLSNDDFGTFIDEIEFTDKLLNYYKEQPGRIPRIAQLQEGGKMLDWLMKLATSSDKD